MIYSVNTLNATLIIRKAFEKDLDPISILFSETIKAINSRDYNPNQITVWSSRNANFWHKKFDEQHFLVAEKGNVLVGFSSLTNSGYIDFLYVHKDYQREGIAKKLVEEIENLATQYTLTEIHTHASITSKPFFERVGFSIVTKQRKMHTDIAFTQYAMKKKLGNHS